MTIRFESDGLPNHFEKIIEDTCLPQREPRCKDCQKPYPFGHDATLPHDQWKAICHISGDEIEIILCANCIVQRSTKLDGVIAIRMRLDFGEEI